MAYASKLRKERFDKIYNALNDRSFQETENLCKNAMRIAKTKKQKKACEGQYINDWYLLLRAWTEDKVTNLHVLRCLKIGFVHNENNLTDMTISTNG